MGDNNTTSVKNRMYKPTLVLQVMVMSYWTKSWRRHNMVISGLILGSRPANERRRYFVTTSLIGWAQT